MCQRHQHHIRILWLGNCSQSSVPSKPVTIGMIIVHINKINNKPISKKKISNVKITYLQKLNALKITCYQYSLFIMLIIMYPGKALVHESCVYWSCMDSSCLLQPKLVEVISRNGKWMFWWRDVDHSGVCDICQRCQISSNGNKILILSLSTYQFKCDL